MTVETISEASATVRLSLNELVILSNCINEAMELGEEFDTRVGSDIEDAADLMRQLHDAINLFGSK